MDKHGGMRVSAGSKMTMNNRQQFRAFSMAEMLLVVIIIGALAAVAVPRFSMATVLTKQDEALIRKLTVDLRKTRMMAIANAADNSSGYQLRINTSAPKSYEIRNLQTSLTVETHPVDSRITFSGTTQFSFTALGTLNPATSVQLTVTGANKSWLLDIYGYTGSVKCTEQ
jgi:type II secretory pathway pseudopilin PulG